MDIGSGKLRYIIYTILIYSSIQYNDKKYVHFYLIPII